jgi:uncharacterized protein YdaU (DUF1376 family)
MAALPYMQLYVADYLADTTHLSAIEHGAYMLLLMNYWQRGKALQDTNGRLANVARMSNEEWNEHKQTLAEFFRIDGETWFHARIERDLAKVKGKSEKASLAGKASGISRSNERSAQERTDVEQTLNHTDTDTEEIRKEKTLSSNPPDTDDRKIVRSVFAYYLERAGRNPSLYTLTEKRMKIGLTRLKECKARVRGDPARAEAAMKDAINGLMTSKFHAGDNADRKKYQEWEDHVFRSQEQMEKWWRELEAA